MTKKCEHLDKIKIIATSPEEFGDIQEALLSIDPVSDFLDGFEYAVRDNCDLAYDLVIKLEHTETPKKNLNKRRYDINIPETFRVLSVTTSTYAEDRKPRVPRYRIELMCEAEGTEAAFKVIYEGLTEPIFHIARDLV